MSVENRDFLGSGEPKVFLRDEKQAKPMQTEMDLSDAWKNKTQTFHLGSLYRRLGYKPD